MIVAFECPVQDAGEALARGAALLRRYGFWEVGEGEWLRGSRAGTGGGIYPRGVRTTLRLAVHERRAEATMRTDPLRGPTSALDRERENRTAGRLAAGVVGYFLLVLAAGETFGLWGAVAMLAVALLMFVVFALLPLRMPRYELSEAPPELSNYPR